MQNGRHFRKSLVVQLCLYINAHILGRIDASIMEQLLKQHHKKASRVGQIGYYVSRSLHQHFGKIDSGFSVVSRFQETGKLGNPETDNATLRTMSSLL